MRGEGEGEREEEEKRTQKTTTLDEKTLMEKLEGIVSGIESVEGVETDDKGEVLMHAIAKDYKTGEVLMLAHMNMEALRLSCFVILGDCMHQNLSFVVCFCTLNAFYATYNVL